MKLSWENVGLCVLLVGVGLELNTLHFKRVTLFLKKIIYAHYKKPGGMEGISKILLLKSNSLIFRKISLDFFLRIFVGS